MTGRVPGGCRSCGADAVLGILDLGDQPVADDLADGAAEALQAPRHRLALGLCNSCGLVQLDPATPLLANAAHGHGGAFSGTVLAHEQSWADELLALPWLPRRARVLDVGSGDGGLLRPFRDAGHAVRGWERNAELVAQARLTGVPTAQLDANSDREPGEHDLVLVNHLLSHADDLDRAVHTLALALAPSGTLAVEFHSALGILTDTQFDVICHAHRSYLSLTALSSALNRYGLTVTSAMTLPLHGGVIRLQAGPVGCGRRPDSSVAALLHTERTSGLSSSDAWTALSDKAARVRSQLRAALSDHWSAGRAVAGYGAPSRGTTLLNYCGIGSSQLPRTADRSPAKWGRYLPGAATAVCTPEQLIADPPAVVLVLIWPLREEVMGQLADLRAAGTRFLFPLPEPELVT